MIKDLAPCVIIQIELINLLTVVVNVPFGLLDFRVDVLGLQLCGPPLLIHDIHYLLFVLDLAVDVFELASEPLRDLVLLNDPLLQLFVLHHLIRSRASEVGDLRMQFTFKVIHTDVLMLLSLVLLLKFNSPALEPLVLNHQVLGLLSTLLVEIRSIVTFLHLLLGLLVHTKFKTSDLVFDILVVLLQLAVLDDLDEELLQFIVFHGLVVLLVT